MIPEIATSSAAFLPTLINGFKDLSATVMYIIPGAIVVFSIHNVTDFNKSNSVFFSSVEDVLDKDVFAKMVVPLYRAITNNLFTEICDSVKNENIRDKKKFLLKYENVKNEKLKEVSFAFINEAIDFQAAIKDIIKSRKNHLYFSELKIDTKNSLIIAGLSGTLSLLLLLSSNISSIFITLGGVSNILLSCYILFLVISIIFFIRYIKCKISLDNLI